MSPNFGLLLVNNRGAVSGLHSQEMFFSEYVNNQLREKTEIQGKI